MSDLDIPTADMVAALSTPAPTDRNSLSRRFFLQAAGASVGVSMLPLWIAEQAGAAAPIGETDGVLLLVTMNGGSDGLSMVAPVHDGTYHDRRGGLALTAGGSHQLTADRGLHPALAEVKRRWDEGGVAIIEGVGDPAGSLSHFEQMARVMTAKSNDGAMTSGWMGRYIDGLAGGSDPFHGVCFGSSVPLVVQGRHRSATAVSTNYSGLVDINTVNQYDRRILQSMAGFGNLTTGRGALTDSLGDAAAQAVDLASQLAPVYEGVLPGDQMEAEMTFAARLINANLGIRVLSIDFGDFDGHADHNTLHQDGFDAFNRGLVAFFATLERRFADQVTVLTTTEFGRRMRANRSGGTDHGAATTLMAIGSQVNGGMYGAMPSLTNLDDNWNLRPTVDYRSVYSTVLETWLDADASQIIGGSYENLGFLARPASKALPPPAEVTTGLAIRDQVMRLYLAYFLREPDVVGLHHWVTSRRDGMTLQQISDAFAASPEFIGRYGSLSNAEFIELVYQNVMGRGSDGSGREYWTGRLASGLSRGGMMIGFSESPEFIGYSQERIDRYDQTGPVARLYQAYFLRAPDTDGLRYWSSSGLSLHQISQSFAVSPEFTDRYGALDDLGFIDRVYQNVMGRGGDAGGVAFWSQELQRGVTRGAMMVGFSESPEFVALFRAS